MWWNQASFVQGHGGPRAGDFGSSLFQIPNSREERRGEIRDGVCSVSMSTKC